MKIGIVSSTVPHVDGGYRKFVNQLSYELQKAGHSVEPIWLPFSSDPETMLAEMVGFRMMNLENICDRLVCCRTPAHVLKHTKKVVWFIHHERIFYDLWKSDYNAIPKTLYWTNFRRAIFEIDTRSLKEAHLTFANSQVVADRLFEFNGIVAEVLYPPIEIPKTLESNFYGAELLFICRIEHHKRQHLAVEAMNHTTTPVRLRIAGATQNPGYLASLQSMVKNYRLEDRVTIDPRWVSEGEKEHLLSQALAVVYVPIDEDSYGYPTLEAANYNRAVVSVKDAGGVCEFVKNEECGFLTEPDPRSLAIAFDRLWLDRKLAENMGRSARLRIRQMGIYWDNVVNRLVA